MGSERRPIGEMLNSIIDYRGKTPPKSDFGIPCISAANVKHGRIDLASASYVSQETYDKWTTRGFPKPGDVVITTEAPAGEVALFPGDRTYLLTRRVMALQVNPEELDNRYLIYALQTPAIKEQLFAVARGTTVPRVLKTDITGLQIPSPPLPEQKAIAHILGSLDDKIELNRRMNATLEGLAQALFQSWFVDFDPVLDNALAAGNPIPDELTDRAAVRRQALDNGTANREAAQHFPATFQFTEELGWIPEGWGVGKIGDIADVIDCLHSKKPTQVNEETGRVLLQLNNISDDGIMDLQYKFNITEDDYQKWISRIELTEGDCVITNVGRVGAASITPKGFKAAIGRNITAIRLRNTTNYRAFLITLLTSQFMKREIQYRTDVGTILNALNVKSIPLLRFPFSDHKTIEYFESLILPLLEKRQRTKSDNLTLAKLRDTLLPQLISGELRIPDAAKLAEAALS